jgi:hypothetical protein
MKLIKISTIVFTIFTLILTIVFFAWWAMEDKLVFGSDKFDQIKWIQSAQTVQTECKRGDMAYDLQQNVLVQGFPRDKVAILLGRPSYEDDNSMAYDLGLCMHIYHNLRITFDKNGRLMLSRILTR